MAIGDEAWERHAREWAHKNAWRWDGTIEERERAAWERVERLMMQHLWGAVASAAVLETNVTKKG